MCEGYLNFSGIKTQTVLDLTGSYIQRACDFDDADIDYQKHEMFGFLGVSKWPQVSRSFRRLKKNGKRC